MRMLLRYHYDTLLTSHILNRFIPNFILWFDPFTPVYTDLPHCSSPVTGSLKGRLTITTGPFKGGEGGPV